MEKGSVDPSVLALVGHEPKGVKRALGDLVFGSKWKEACDAEVDNLIRNGTFKLVPLYDIITLKQSN